MPPPSGPFWVLFPQIFTINPPPARRKARLLHPPLSSISNAVWIFFPRSLKILLERKTFAAAPAPDSPIPTPLAHQGMEKGHADKTPLTLSTTRRSRCLISFPNGHLVSGVQVQGGRLGPDSIEFCRKSSRLTGWLGGYLCAIKSVSVSPGLLCVYHHREAVTSCLPLLSFSSFPFVVWRLAFYSHSLFPVSSPPR